MASCPLRSRLVLILAASVLGGCRSAPAPVAQAKLPPAVAPQVAFKPEGFVIYKVFGRLPLVLQDDYGVMMINDGDERKPRARFILAVRKGRKLVDTHDFATFRRALRRIPRKTKVCEYDTCTTLRSYGLRQADFDRFDRAMRRFKPLKDGARAAFHSMF